MRSVVCCHKTPYRLASTTKEGNAFYVNVLGHVILAANLPFDHAAGSITLMLVMFVKNNEMSNVN